MPVWEGNFCSLAVCVPSSAVLWRGRGRACFESVLYVAFACRRCLETGSSDKYFVPSSFPNIRAESLALALALAA